MARSRSPRGGSAPAEPDTPAAPPAPPFLDYPGETTGRFLVLYKEGATAQAVNALKDAAGLSAVASTADSESGALTPEEVADADLLVFDKLGVAVVAADPSQAAEVMTAAADEGNDLILAVEPERVVRALMIPVDELAVAAGPADLRGYMSGYRDAVNFLYDKLFGGGGGPAGGPGLVGPEAVFFDTPTLTWGLQATRAGSSRFSGQGVRVAVLDTGFDLQHPDFVGRPVVSQSFVPGQAVQDGHGHGTHCIGTACGPLRPATGVRRYGCAHGASIFAGKVLSNAGSGTDAGILNGINWAITNGCRVVSMSLGAPVQPGQTFSQVFETAARRALAANTLIVAAAGNSSRLPNGTRRNPPNPVGHPANCPSIMAVAAVDNRLGVAPFSDGGINTNGGGVDIAAPGVAVFSSVPAASGRHAVMSGTSMATPHVAGIAAMHLQARGLGTSAQALWQILTSTALRLPLLARDVGAGLVQAPV